MRTKERGREGVRERERERKKKRDAERKRALVITNLLRNRRNSTKKFCN